MTANTWLLEDGRVVDPAAGRDKVESLYVCNGRIAPLPSAVPASVPRLNVSGMIVAPGLIDLHVHFRDPGDAAAETVESGSRAAARGGFTTVVTMPNTKPPTDNAELIKRAIALGSQAGCVRLLPAGCLTKGREGREVADLRAMQRAGAAAFTDDGSTVADDRVLEQAMRLAAELGVPVMDHALDPAASGVMHEGESSARLGLPGIPACAETRIVERDLRLCAATGCALHIQHVSCRDSVELIRSAQRRGLPVTGEATPHHLTLTDADVSDGNTNLKMNPPLRSARDRDALLEGVADGTLQALATDHAPHTSAAKAGGFLRAPFGVVGLETAAAVTYSALVKSGLMTLTEWLRRWTAGPAAVLGRAVPSLAPGQAADILVFDPNLTWTVQASRFASKSGNSPFDGWALTGRPLLTLHEGRMTWDLRPRFGEPLA